MNTLSISEVAKIAGVSTTTVSRVLNGKGYVSEEKKQKVMWAVHKTNYQPKKYKRGHNTSNISNVIGVVVPDIGNSYFTGIIRGIDSIAQQKGYEIFVCDTEENPGKEIKSISSLYNSKVGGIIIAVASDMAEYNAEYLRNLNENGTPIVLVDRDLRIPGIESVVMENSRGAKSAVDVLIENGHNHIAILSGPTSSRTGVERLNGYIESLQEHGMALRQEYICYGDFRPKSGYDLTKRILTMHPAVTAIFSSNQRMTLGCLQAITEAGLKIPDDISLISFGLPDTLKALGMAISHIYQPSPPLGEESARILFSKIELGKKYKKMPSKRTIFSTECVLLGSEKYPINKTER